MRDLKLYIDGKFVDAEGKKTYESLNPANGEVVARVALAEVRDAQKAIAAARAAFDHGPWRQFSAQDRKGIIERLAAALKERLEEFALMETADAGALIAKSRTDVALCVSQLKYFARMGEKYDNALKPVEGMQKEGRAFTYTSREPVGVCGQIIPWNFPLTMAVWKLGPALATGNTVVLKCAPETPVTALELAKLCHEVGFPPGVVNILTGDAEVGEAIVTSPLVDKVSFTGSTEIGKRVMSLASGTLKKVTLECGGKSANIVLDDADRELAVDGSLYATFFHSGQVCESGTRLLLSKKQHENFVEALIDRASVLRVGDPMDPATTVGPLVSDKQLKRVMRYIDVGKQQGAKLVLGGMRAMDGALKNGYFVQPTIFTEVQPEHTIAQEEIFGPVLSIMKFTDIDDAVRIANDTIFGLAAGVWSKDVAQARDVASRLRAGWVWINEWHVLSPMAPFGGYKQSGLGREFGEDGLNAYTELKTTYQDDMKTRDARSWYDVVVPR